MTGNDIASSPTQYPIAIDRVGQHLQFVPMSQKDYQQASFLDVRMLGANPQIETRAWNDVSSQLSEQPVSCNFIFHVSHAGSTLLSRLLGDHEQVFSLREPAILRNLADVYLWLQQGRCDWSSQQFDDRLLGLLRLWSRTFSPAQTSLIKATSFASDMAVHLLQLVPHSRAMLMYVRAEVFLAALLNGTRNDITAAAQNRWARLHRYLKLRDAAKLESLTIGEGIAMSWLTEMLALDNAATYAGDRTLWIDFDQFLASPKTHLAECLRLLAIANSPETIDALAANPAMTRYSKAPQHEYSPQVRDQLLTQSGDKFHAEIARGMGWLEQLAARFPQVQRVLSR